MNVAMRERQSVFFSSPRCLFVSRRRRDWRNKHIRWSWIWRKKQPRKKERNMWDEILVVISVDAVRADHYSCGGRCTCSMLCSKLKFTGMRSLVCAVVFSCGFVLWSEQCWPGARIDDRTASTSVRARLTLITLQFAWWTSRCFYVVRLRNTRSSISSWKKIEITRNRNSAST